MKKSRNLIKCSVCPEGKNWKKPKEFYTAKNKRGYQSKCRECQLAYHSELLRKYRIPLVKMATPSVATERPCLGNCDSWRMSKKAWMCSDCRSGHARNVQRERLMYN